MVIVLIFLFEQNYDVTSLITRQLNILHSEIEMLKEGDDLWSEIKHIYQLRVPPKFSTKSGANMPWQRCLSILPLLI